MWRSIRDLLTPEITRIRDDDGASLLEPVERSGHCGGQEQRKSARLSSSQVTYVLTQRTSMFSWVMKNIKFQVSITIMLWSHKFLESSYI